MAESSACSVMDTTRMPLRLSIDLKATACSRFRVNLENFQTNISLKGAWGLAGLVDHLLELRPVGYPPALGLVDVLAATWYPFFSA